MVDHFIKDFGDKNGIRVTTVKAGTGELLNRIRDERGRPAGDVMWGGFSDTGSSSPDLFDVYRSPRSCSSLNPFLGILHIPLFEKMCPILA